MTDPLDLVRELRDLADAEYPIEKSLMLDAADLIESQHAEVTRLLADIAEWGTTDEEHEIAVLRAELTRLRAVEKAFRRDTKAGRFICECEWGEDEAATRIRECDTHAALREKGVESE